MIYKKIETLHIAVEEELDRSNPLLLCGVRYSDLNYMEDSWSTFDEFVDEPLMEDDYSKEVMCEECKNHPDFIIRFLGNV